MDFTFSFYVSLVLPGETRIQTVAQPPERYLSPLWGRFAASVTEVKARAKLVYLPW